MFLLTCSFLNNIWCGMYSNPNYSDADTQILVHDHSTVTGSEWLTLGPGRFTVRWKNAGTHWKEGWVGPGTGSDVLVKSKFSSCCRKSKSGTPSPYRTWQKCEREGSKNSFTFGMTQFICPVNINSLNWFSTCISYVIKSILTVNFMCTMPS